jgi:hypothetical protein
MASMSKSFAGSASFAGGEAPPINSIGMLHMKLKFSPFAIPGADVVEFDDQGQPKPKVDLHPQKRKVSGRAGRGSWPCATCQVATVVCATGYVITGSAGGAAAHGAARLRVAVQWLQCL